MRKADFYIGLEFYVARYDKEGKTFKPVKWRCTDRALARQSSALKIKRQLFVVFDSE